jgi:pimeloyl-ACP methyl ester carboxylesterase
MSLTAAAPPPWTHHHIVVNRVRLHYVEAGVGPLVILLHGFPEFWYSWQHQIPALAAAGFRVVAPDTRGYNESAKPPGVRSYDLDLLTTDVTGLIRRLGQERAIVVGHDWGGAVAWHVALTRPDVVERLIILNAPHPAVFVRELRTWAQLRKSWYMFFFQLPLLPELLLRRDDFASLKATLRTDPLRPGTFTATDIRHYCDALARPGALTATVNYYRAVFRRNLFRAVRDINPIDVPTLVIWGEVDRYIGLQALDGLDRWVRRLRVERLPGVSHWVQNEAPEEVNRRMIDFMREG